LTKIAQNEQSDPFLTGIKRMINEEMFICEIQEQKSNDLNQELIIELERIRKYYERKANVSESDRQNLTLPNIYDLIKSMNEIPTVNVQLDAIRKYHQHLLESNQRIVHVNESHRH